MSDTALIDANILLLFIIGSISTDQIRKHKRLGLFDIPHYETITDFLKLFDNIIVTPHILTETSNLARYSSGSLGPRLATTLREQAADIVEHAIPSEFGLKRREFEALGLTDAVILEILDHAPDGDTITLISSDRDLVNRARSLGFSVYDVLAELQ